MSENADHRDPVDLEILVDLWNRAMAITDNDHLAEKIRLLEEIVRRARTPLHVAALANAYVLGCRFDESTELFNEAISKSSDRSEPHYRYIYLYCRIYLAVRQNASSFYELMKEAASVPCSPALRRWLPLPLTRNASSQTENDQTPQ